MVAFAKCNSFGLSHGHPLNDRAVMSYVDLLVSDVTWFQLTTCLPPTYDQRYDIPAHPTLADE